MKANSTKTAKPVARNGKLKPAGGKQTIERSAETIGTPRGRVKSTVPPQFRELKQLAAAQDSRFWALRREFKDYLYSLPEEAAEPFMEGLEQPYLDYLVMALVQERDGRKLIYTWWPNEAK